MQQRDPEGLTDGKDWTVHVNEFLERREDGLCMDTISGSTKLRRKSIIPGAPEAVLQSVSKLEAPTATPPSNPRGKQDGAQAIASDNSRVNSNPEAFQRSECTWETLMHQSSGARIKRSQSFHYRIPKKPDGTTRSLNSNTEVQRQREMIRSKSLRAYRYHGSPSGYALPADETLPFTGLVISVKSGGTIEKQKSLEKRPEDQRSDANAANVMDLKSKEATGKAKDRWISRSGSAPSVRAKETVTKHNSEEPRRQRSESLRWIPEPDYQTVSIEELVKSGERTNEIESLDKRSEQQRPVKYDGSTNAVTAKNDKGMVENKPISRSGSAPSAQAKEKVVKREAEVPQRKRSTSLRWIPEPDYQSVSMEDLVSAAQTLDKGSNKDNVCVVEIHSAPKDSIVTKSLSTDGTGGAQEIAVSPNSSSHQASSSDENQKQNTSGDFVTSLSVPGVAQRVLSELVTLSDQRREQSSGKVTEINNTSEEPVSVKNRIQNLESQIPPARPSSALNQDTRLMVDRVADSTNNSNSKPKELLNSNKGPAANVKVMREEPNFGSSPADMSSFNTEQPEVRSIGKMKIVKNGAASPAWLENEERTLKRPIRDNPSRGLERPSPTTSQLRDLTSTGNAVVTYRKPEESRPSTSDLVKAALRNKNKRINDGSSSSNSKDNNNNNIALTIPPTNSAFGEAQSEDVQLTISPKINEDFSSAIYESVTDKEPNAPVSKDVDIGLSLEEKKRTWKREQLVDQLQSARQRNSNQNYIFGTGLAYQSCMPELQSKLKQLTLSK